MRALSRFFAMLSSMFAYKASAKELEARIAKLEGYQAQMRVDIAKCKLMVGLNQLTDVTPTEV